ncbi:MAG TPA: DUF6152 family protein [Terriglobia bacterium]|nr:DUF6152 family protein [Terriglobia bacterium]
MGRAFVLIVMLSIGAATVFAHHGRGATYDTKRQVALKGTVSQLLWRNPHIAIYVDVKGDDGKTVTWVIEHSNISQLARLGYGRNTLQVGMDVTAYVNPGARGEPIGLCQKIVLADGKEIFQRDDLPPNLRRGAAGLVVD